MLSEHPMAALGMLAGAVLSFAMMMGNREALDNRREERLRAAIESGAVAGRHFAVRYPSEDSVVTRSRVTFYGVAAPGSVIRHGKKTVKADKSGQWSMTVAVKRGENRVTFTSTKGKIVALDTVTVRY